MDVEIREALPGDQGPIVELIYSSGPELYDFLYKKKAKKLLQFEFQSGYGFAGYKNVTVAILDDKVVGTGCFFGQSEYNALVKGTVGNVSRYCGKICSIPVLMRSRHMGSVMHPPKQGELYLSNFGVDPQYRGMGIGSKMIQHKLAEAREQGYETFGLDVSAQNPRGQALYERLGLKVLKEKVFPLKKAGVPDSRKMELTL